MVVRELPLRQYSVVELFCGCGGFSHGFKLTGRFDIMLGNDIKKAALRTFQFNHATNERQPEILDRDIREISIDTIKIALERQGIQDGELDVLIGGPPCQGFSQMRRSEERKGSELVKFKGYNKLDQDPRNDLVLRFLEIASALRPKIIVIENVPQMLRHTHDGVAGGMSLKVEAMLLGEMGYHVVIDTLNAANYGVPQLRERAFFLASRLGTIEFPEPTHIDPQRPALFSFNKPSWITVAEAISDLPKPPLGPLDKRGGKSVNNYPKIQLNGASYSDLSDFAKLMRSKKQFPFNHVTRRYSTKIMRIIAEMQPGETWDHASERMIKKYQPKVLKYHEDGEKIEETIARLDERGVVIAAFFRSYYWSAYSRLAWERPALTITANANFLGSGRFSHPDQNRGITMREAARLQSFDDDFRFITSTADDDDTTKIGIGMDMIGEAVPPLLARALAESITAHLDQHSWQDNNEVQSEKEDLQIVAP